MTGQINTTTGSRVRTLIERIFERNGRAAQFEPDTGLVDAGMTSVDMVDLMLALESEFDVMIPAGDITPGNFRSMATIETMMNRACAPKAA